MPGAVIAHSLEDAVARCAGDSEIFIIGGGELYTLVLPIADRILATEVDGKFEGDTYFPELAEGAWRETARQSHEDAASRLRYCFVTLERT